MTTLILGSNGFIGRRLTSLLASQGEEVVGMDIAPPPPGFEELAPQVRFIRGDLRRFDDVVASMLSVRPTRVVNLAYMLGSDHAPHVAQQLNVVGMDNCFEASRLADVEHVVFGSSLAVNGKQTYFGERFVTEEDHLYGIGYQYATHKIFNEWQAKDYREKHGMNITAVRPANVSGHDKVFGSVDHVQIITGPALGRPVSFKYADAMRSPIHVDDVADIFAKITLTAKPEHDVYNTGGTATSLGELAELVKEFVPGAGISFENEVGGKADCTNYLIDNSRLRKEFGFEFPSLRERVQKIIADVRAEQGRSTVTSGV
ncbi:NAD-dependent epimerase/dehydratase family protein [Rhodococcus sp. NPDC127530]|uniref:NAD-dependent epimerase/dehydratase family protein n=1 Tax=unclassified Rhodococcus (in: high G+C Gram-positive bacteria) TaxID=192944 RepID=UPI003629341A